MLTLVSCGNSSSKSKAFDYCIETMKNRLKSPSSAVFPAIDESVIISFTPLKLPSGKVKTKYLVKSYVDSQNSFGAMIRTKFSCTATGDNSGEWELNSIYKE